MTGCAEPCWRSQLVVMLRKSTSFNIVLLVDIITVAAHLAKGVTLFLITRVFFLIIVKLNNERLRAFYQVAVDKNFHKAAENICITQSAFSQRILKLEQEVGATLVIRGSEGIKLTEAGLNLFAYVRDLKNREEETLALITGHAAGVASGSLRIAAYSSVLQSVIMPALSQLIHDSPDLHVEFFSRELGNLPDMLKSGEVDFIVLDYYMDALNVKNILIGAEHLVHIKNIGRSEDDQVFLDHDVDDMTTYNFFREQDRKNVELRRCYYDDIYGIIKGVELGLGQAVVSRHLIADADDIQIVTHPVSVTNPVVLYHQENRYLTSFHREVVRSLQERAASFLD